MVNLILGIADLVLANLAAQAVWSTVLLEFGPVEEVAVADRGGAVVGGSGLPASPYVLLAWSAGLPLASQYWASHSGLPLLQFVLWWCS